MMYDIVNEYGYNKEYDYLNDVIKHTLEVCNVLNACFSIIFIDDEKMKSLNHQYRHIDRTTDVLSFALEDNLSIKENIRMLGDIYISIPQMISQANSYSHSEKRELSFLCCHGLLHLLGYDHTKSQEEEKRQFELQEIILSDLDIIS